MRFQIDTAKILSPGTCMLLFQFCRQDNRLNERLLMKLLWLLLNFYRQRKRDNVLVVIGMARCNTQITILYINDDTILRLTANIMPRIVDASASNVRINLNLN